MSYGFSADGQMFVEEWLHGRPLGHKQVWFDGEQQDLKFGDGPALAGSPHRGNFHYDRMRRLASDDSLHSSTFYRQQTLES